MKHRFCEVYMIWVCRKVAQVHDHVLLQNHVKVVRIKKCETKQQADYNCNL